MPPKVKPGRGRPRKADINNENHVPKKAKITLTHSTHCKTQGFVFALGEGDTGQLGLGEDIMERSKPARVPDLPEDIVQVVAGGMHTTCLTATGHVYSFGCNDEGGLGRDTSQEGSEYSAGKVQLDQHIVQISAGDSHTAALTSDGNVYAWGTFRDANGPIGLTKQGQESKPVLVFSSVPVVKISSGSDHLAVLTTEGFLYTWGNGEQGQLGRVAECFATRGGRKGIDVLIGPAPVYCRKVKGKRLKFTDIWCGTYNTFARAENADIYAWGLNNYGQTGFSDLENKFMPEKVQSFCTEDWAQIESGQHHTIALSSDGKVFSLGRDTYGRLGLGEDSGEKQEPTLIPAIREKCHKIAAASSVSFAITKSGGIYSWGMGSSNQLGIGNEEDVWVPEKMTGKQLQSRTGLLISAGGQHTMILAKDKA